jgi:glutamate N-acetyltransferase/amino-acid N-acetyltransferase
MAVGKCADERDIEPQRTSIRFGATTVFELGSAVECDLAELQKYLAQQEVEIGVDLGLGHASARVWGCDLTEGYVKENAYYTT